ncbi:MAG: potassium transporter [Phocaeicola sp.]|nr:potassium transporter [Phocaeicola sp.]
MEPLYKLFIYRKRLIRPYIGVLLKWMDGLTYVMSVILILTLVCEHGFLISSEDLEVINRLYRVVWIVFLGDISFHFLLNYSDTKRKYRGLAWILSLMLYFTLIPVVFYEPEVQGGVHDFWCFFHSRLYHVVLLTLLSLLQLSNGVVRLLGRRTNPSLIFAFSFLIVILIGAALLMLPRATYHGISFVDALFTATSATCVTGLVSVDVSSTFTPIGLFVIIVLIQIGGLGVMTLTSFFAMFFMGNTSLYNQLVIRDMVSSQSLGSLFSTLLYVLVFTLAIEIVGMGIIFLSIHGTMGIDIEEELAFSAFHSISAFCNAGFSTLYGNLGNEQVFHHHNLMYITLSFLIILGGIGFPILVNLYETVSYECKCLYHRYIKRDRKIMRRIHLYNLNTRIVLIMTTILLVVGTVSIVAFEWNHAFDGLTVLEKWVHGFFNSVCPRTAGFSSVGMTTFSVQTLLLMVVLMMIGGGTQSTAGGVKVNVFAMVILNLRAVLTGADKVNIFSRELSYDSIRRSNATLILYLLIVFIGIFVLSILEPQVSVLALVFECVSALSTVGSSLDLTPTLGSDSKLVVIVLMFIGRVGVLTLISGLVRQAKIKRYKYPSDNVIINN